MNCIWLREDGEGKVGDGGGSYKGGGSGYWRVENKRRCVKLVDPVLGFNLEGGLSDSNQRVTDVLSKQFHDSMEHDLEDPTLIGKEGKKRSRVEYDNSAENDDISKVLSRNRRVEEHNLILSTVAKRQAARTQSKF